MNTLEDFLKIVPIVEASRNYWFFRTEGGKLFSPFIEQNIIALDYADIPDEKVNWLISGNNNEKKIKFLTEKYPQHGRPSIIISNLKKFYIDMKVGDFVLIPAASGKSVAVGKIESGVKAIEGVKIKRKDGKIYVERKYQRSRKMTWLVQERKSFISYKLYGLFNTHQAISRANDYSEWINNLVYTVYKQNDKYHYVINVKQKHGLTGKTVFGCFSDLLSLTDDFLKEEEIGENTDGVEIKIAISTPGWLTFIGESGTVIAAILLLIFFVNGGTGKFTGKNISFEIESSGLLKRINEFLNSEEDRKIKDALIEKIKSLEIGTPIDVNELLNSVNKKNQN
jgi:hypothetical protein